MRGLLLFCYAMFSISCSSAVSDFVESHTHSDLIRFLEKAKSAQHDLSVDVSSEIWPASFNGAVLEVQYFYDGIKIVLKESPKEFTGVFLKDGEAPYSMSGIEFEMIEKYVYTYVEKKRN